jgi:hypothetical protein
VEINRVAATRIPANNYKKQTTARRKFRRSTTRRNDNELYVVGIFDDKSEARQAMEELVQGGFVREHIDFRKRINRRRQFVDCDSGATTNQGAGDSISNFFSNLFGDDETQARSYTNVARDADAILTVQADSEERARQVADIFDRNGRD